jgi:hypothetical protein
MAHIRLNTTTSKTIAKAMGKVMGKVMGKAMGKKCVYIPSRARAANSSPMQILWPFLPPTSHRTALFSYK